MPWDIPSVVIVRNPELLTPPVSLARLEHLLQYTHEGAVLHRRRHALLVAQLLVHRRIRAVGALLDAHINAKSWRQGLLEAHAHAQANDGGQRAMGDGWRDLDEDGADRRERRRWRHDVDIG
jgi:hypothetical protein